MENLDLPERIHRYRILSELGRGSMGRVYLAEDPNIERRLALKVLSPRRLVDRDHEEELRERFLVEARAAGRLHHPGIVTVYDADKDPQSGVPYLAMEYIDGPSLQELLQDGHPLPVVETLRLLSQVAYALDYAHRQEVVHRDIKPANLLVQHDHAARPVAKVVDFGIAKLVSASLTQPGYIVGTPNYMAPEQIRGQAVDGRADLFALGAVLYESLTGRTAFGSHDLANVHYKILSVDPRPPEMHNPAVTPAVRTVVDRALAKDPDGRFQTGQEMAEALETAANELTTTTESGENQPRDRDTSATRRLSYTSNTPSTSSRRPLTNLDSLRDPRLPVAVGGESGSRWWYPVASGAFALLAVIAFLALIPEFAKLQRRSASPKNVEVLVKPPWRVVATPPFSTPNDSAKEFPLLLLPSEPPPAPALDGPALNSSPIAPSQPLRATPPINIRPPLPDPRPAPPQQRPTATTSIEVVFRSYEREAYLSAWIDGRKVLTERMKTGPLRRLLGREFRFAFPVPAGLHTLELHLSGVSRKLEAQRKIRHLFPVGQPQVLRIRLENKEIDLRFEVPES